MCMCAYVCVSVCMCASVSNDDIVRVEHSLFYSFQVHSRDYGSFYVSTAGMHCCLYDHL